VSDDSGWPLEALPGIRGVRRRIRLGLTGQRSGWYPPMNLTDRIVVMLVYAQRLPAVGLVARGLLQWRGTDIITTDIAPGLHLLHGGVGVVIHGSTSIGVNVTVFHNVTIGRRDPWRPWTPRVQRVAIGEDAVLCAGAVILSDSTSSQPLIVGRGTIIGANSVLAQSTGEGEIWVGAPARKIANRRSWPDGSALDPGPHLAAEPTLP
jgi:serine O-acetyltransferase